MAAEVVIGLAFVGPIKRGEEPGTWVPCSAGDTPEWHMVYAFIHGMWRSYTAYPDASAAQQYARKLDHLLRGT